jgi:predicted DNA-binding transcriptional regulator AlpA
MSPNKPRQTVVLLDYHAVAERLGMDTRILRLWKSRGKLPDPDFVLAHSPGWLPETIDAWLDTFETGTTPATRKEAGR